MMRTVKMIFRLRCATTIAFLFGLLPMGFRAADFAPESRIDQHAQSCPTANFTYSGAVVSLPTQFINLSTLAESYSWDFGDGTGSTETNPQHTYTAPGSYQVRLTAYGGGCEVSYIGTADVVL